MKKIDPIIYIYVLLMWIGMTVSYEVQQFRSELQQFRGSIVFDIDKVRNTLLDEMQYMYFEGCRQGINYPDEYKKPQTGFNEHSPTIYCNDERAKLGDYILDKMTTIGR